MFLDFMMEASKVYRPSSSYINDVLSLKNRHLLCDVFVDEKETADLIGLRRDFKQHIRSFIQSEKLKGISVCTAFMNSVVCQVFVCARVTVCVQLAVYCTYQTGFRWYTVSEHHAVCFKSGNGTLEGLFNAVFSISS